MIHLLDKNVPFQCWVADNAFAPLSNSTQLCQARGSAVIALGKGCVFALIDAVKCIFHAIFNKEQCATQYKGLKRQCSGVCLSAVAIWSPTLALEKFYKAYLGKIYSKTLKSF